MDGICTLSDFLHPFRTWKRKWEQKREAKRKSKIAAVPTLDLFRAQPKKATKKATKKCCYDGPPESVYQQFDGVIKELHVKIELYKDRFPALRRTGLINLPGKDMNNSLH